MAGLVLEAAVTQANSTDDSRVKLVDRANLTLFAGRFQRSGNRAERADPVPGKDRATLYSKSIRRPPRRGSFDGNFTANHWVSPKCPDGKLCADRSMPDEWTPCRQTRSAWRPARARRGSGPT